MTLKYDVYVNGTSMFDKYGLILSSFGSENPQPKTSYVDIPGGNGSLDMTEALGEVAFDDRTFDFDFHMLAEPGEFERAMTGFRSDVMGKLVAFKISWDPDYEFKGRFSIASTEHRLWKCSATIHVVAEPYKRKPDQALRVRAGGGANVDLPSGRMSVSPVLECSRATVVACNGVSETLPAGSHKVRGLYLHEGVNKMYLNSTPGLAPSKWEDYAADTWGDCSGMTWAEVAWRGHERPTGDQYDVYVTYEWGDL